MVCLNVSQLPDLSLEKFEGSDLPLPSDGGITSEKFMGRVWFSLPTAVEHYVDRQLQSSSLSVSKENLSYLQVSHWDYQEAIVTGEFIVHKSIAVKVMLIFSQLFKEKFPIDCLRLPGYFGKDQEIGNNSFAFSVRPTCEKGQVTSHQKGFAIDLNPRSNLFPEMHVGYLPPSYSKESDICGVIDVSNRVVEIFRKEGFVWGGMNPDQKDEEYPRLSCGHFEFIPSGHGV